MDDLLHKLPQIRNEEAVAWERSKALHNGREVKCDTELYLHQLFAWEQIALTLVLRKSDNLGYSEIANCFFDTRIEYNR